MKIFAKAQKHYSLIIKYKENLFTKHIQELVVNVSNQKIKKNRKREKHNLQRRIRI